MGGELYVGLMSGTSMDGIDAALCRIDEKGCELLRAQTYPLDPALKAELLAMIGGTTTLQTVGKADHRLGVAFADAVNTLLEQSGVAAEAVRAVGSHGQTVWHRPEGDAPFSMQLGDPNIIAARTGIAVAADFRRKDMALGGQGAPFAPAFHRFVFGALKGCTAVLNVGGMANISVLDGRLSGYDTGPGNVLMDLWASKHLGRAYDAGGEWARGGRVHEGLLDAMLADPFFAQQPPKSTGRERFNAAWLDEKLARFPQVGAQAVQATLLALTVRSAADEAARFAPQRLLVCGGGAENGALMASLEARLSCEVAPTERYGVPGGALEAMAFAWLAYKRLRNEPVALKEVTGAAKNSVLGGWYA